VNTEVPPFFRLYTVVRAFKGILERRSVVRRLKAIGAIESVEGNVNLVNAARVHEHWPTVYHRCVQIWNEEEKRKGGGG